MGYLSTAEAARRIGCSAEWVRKACRDEELPGDMISGVWMLDEALLESWIAKGKLPRKRGPNKPKN